MKVKLCKIADIMTGTTPSMKVDEYYDSNDIPFIKPDSFKSQFQLEASSFISNKAERKARVVYENCILVTCIGIIGKVGITSQKVAFNQQINSLNVKPYYDIEYIAYNILFNKDRLQRICNSAVVPLINKTQFSNFEISINKDIVIQRDIKNRLNLLSSIINNNKKKLLLLEDIIKSRFVELFGDPVLNEKGWDLTSLESVCQSIYGGGTPSKKIKEYYMGTIPWVTSKDMKSDIIVDSIEHITQVAIDNSSTKIIPPESVLIVIRSGILKHTLPVCINKSRVTINQDLKALVLDERCKAIYLQYLLKALEKDILSGVRAVTADNIEFNSLKKRKIPIPPINIQIKFSQMVNQINKLKSDVQKSINETQLLMDSLMQEYFG
ncbi:restriction endonuclease subunit S [Veillonella parvula]|uniref:restriction endonuclease subunit S n=1 Tax=Veillonella parvula TaxID=29466 RepID=UPI0028EC2E75|nr:restriction endonuclease subunit S [Veillonella parvula]